MWKVYFESFNLIEFTEFFYPVEIYGAEILNRRCFHTL